MKARVTKRFSFEAAHHLPNHDGKCHEVHGHSYKADIVCEGPINTTPGHPKEGMVIDFADLKETWKQICEPVLDHQDLNETLNLSVPTAEAIAIWICLTFKTSHPLVKEVTVWETDTCCATVTAQELWINGDH